MNEKLVVRGALEVVVQRTGLIVVGGVVEHHVNIVEGVDEVGVVGKSDEDGKVVYMAMVGVLVSDDLTFGGHYHLTAQLEIFLTGDAQVGNQPFGGGVALAGDPCRGLEFAVLFDGIDKIAGLRVLDNGIAIGVVQTQIEFIATGKAVQCVAVGLHQSARYVGKIGG